MHSEPVETNFLQSRWTTTIADLQSVSSHKARSWIPSCQEKIPPASIPIRPILNILKTDNAHAKFDEKNGSLVG